MSWLSLVFLTLFCPSPNANGPPTAIVSKVILLLLSQFTGTDCDLVQAKMISTLSTGIWNEKWLRKEIKTEMDGDRELKITYEQVLLCSKAEGGSLHM